MAGLFQAFDLVVARDSPFIRQFCRILNSSDVNVSWADRFYPIVDNIFEIDGDIQFKGFQWDTQRRMPLSFFCVLSLVAKEQETFYFFGFPQQRISVIPES